MLIYFNTEGINKYFIYPFISFFFLVAASFTAGQSSFGKFAYTQNLIISIAEIMAIIPYYISLQLDEGTFRNNSKRSILIRNDNEKSLSIQLEYTNTEEELSHLECYHIILLGFVDFLQSFCMFYGNDIYENNYQLYFWSSYILFLTIFKKCLLNTRLYRHQIMSFIIFFILDILYTILITTDKEIEYDKYQLFFLFISNFCFSFEIVFEKKLLESSFISFYKLCFLLGVSTFFYNLIISILTSIISKKISDDSKFKKYFFQYSDYFDEVSEEKNVFLEIFLIILFIIFNGLYNIFQFITIKYLSPNHVLITQIMLAIYLTVINKITEGGITLLSFILSIVIHVLCFITLLIFIEIIQLNFCGINKDTVLHIGLRSDVDRYFDTFSVGTFNQSGGSGAVNNSLNKTIKNNLSNENVLRERTVSYSENSEADYSFDSNK
jgi:hypothetical protein